MKNKIKAFASALSVMALAVPMMVRAQFAVPTGTNLPEAKLTDIITKFMDWLLTMVGIIGVIGFAIAGILYLTAAGDEGRIESAKRAMLYSIVGVIVAIIGVVALKAAQGLLGGEEGF